MTQHNLEAVAAQIPRDRHYFRRHVERYEKILERLPSGRRLNILDVGVGYGFLAAAMKQAGHQVSGVDFFYGQVAERVCQQFEIPLLMLNIESEPLPYRSQCFDVVVLAEVIEHLTGKASGPLKEIHRVLKRDGVLILTTPNAGSAVNRLKKLVGRKGSLTARGPVIVQGKPYLYGHHHLFQIDELRSLLKEAGYRISSEKFIFPGQVSPGGLAGWVGAALVRVMGWWKPHLKSIIMIEARPFDLSRNS